MPSKKKIFVLDTNVILHDSDSIYKFDEHDVVIPITVLEELDFFKKGNDTINFHARNFARNIDEISEDKLFNTGLSLGKGKGKISIILERAFDETMSFFTQSKPDHKILNIAYDLTVTKKSKTVILVTKDVNLRMKAKSINVRAEDYQNDKISINSDMYAGHRIQEGVRSEIVEKLYNKEEELKLEDMPELGELQPHENVIIRNGNKSGLATYNPFSKTLNSIEKQNVFGITPRNAEQTFAINHLLDDNIKLISITGNAGTGKTLIALASALQQKKKYRQIFLARPVIPLSNKDIGYLPGDIKSKLDPYMQPLYDNLSIIRNQFSESDAKALKIDKLLAEEKLVISPLSYIRGRSLVKIYYIVDEAQNLTPHEIKTIITRAGEGSKFIFTGDIYQIDHPYLDTTSNGLSYLISKMKGQNIYAHVNLERGERSELADIASKLL